MLWVADLVCPKENMPMIFLCFSLLWLHYGRSGDNFKSIITCYKLSWWILVKLLSGECHRTLLMISKIGSGLGAIMQVVFACVDPDLCCHMAQLGHNELALALSGLIIYIFRVTYDCPSACEAALKDMGRIWSLTISKTVQSVYVSWMYCRYNASLII